MATANEVFVNPNPSASLMWSSMILLKDVITNAEHISLAPENLGRQAPANKFPIFLESRWSALFMSLGFYLSNKF